MQHISKKIMPFIFLGIGIVILVAGLVLLSYLLIFGAIIGLVIFAIAWIKEKFFPSKNMTTHDQCTGRTIDHEK